jgi:ParB/RepB/Spo0J family partition protein
MTEQIKLKQITPSQTNPRRRIDPPELEELMASIKEVGIIEPLVVRQFTINKGKPTEYQGSYEIICGERRYRAAEKLGLETVPCDIREGLSQDDVENMQLHENIHRKDLSPIEECDVYHRLREKGTTVEEIAQRAGKSESYVSRRLSLANLTPEIRADHEAGHLSLTATAELAKYSTQAQTAIYNQLYEPIDGSEPKDVEDFFNEIVEEEEEKADSGESAYYNETSEEWDDDAITAEAKKRLEAHQATLAAASGTGEVWNKSEVRMGADRIRSYMQNTLSARLDQFAFSMDDDRLRKDKLTCTDCRNRTGLITGLFDTGDEEPVRCLDRQCLTDKLDTFIQITRKEIAKKAKKKVEDIPMATKRYLHYGEERVAGLLYDSDFRALHEDETDGYYGMCEKATTVILADTGAVFTACIKANACDQHFGSSRSSGSPREKAPEGSPLALEQQAMKRSRKEEIWDVKVGEEVRARIISEASGRFAIAWAEKNPQVFELAAVTARLLETTAYNDRGIADKIAERVKLELPKDGGWQDKESYREKVDQLKPEMQALVLFILTHCVEGDMRSGSWRSQTGVKAIAEKWGFNYKLIDATVRLELSPKKHEKKHKAYLDQVTVGDPAAKLPRVYEESYICPDDRPKAEPVEADEEPPDAEPYAYECPSCGRMHDSLEALDEGDVSVCPECQDEAPDEIEDEDDAFGEAPEQAESPIADAQATPEPVLEADATRSVPPRSRRTWTVFSRKR